MAHVLQTPSEDPKSRSPNFGKVLIIELQGVSTFFYLPRGLGMSYREYSGFWIPGPFDMGRKLS